MIEQRHQVGIINGVVDNEPGIDGDRTGRAGGGDGVGVAAESVVLLIDRHVMMLVE